MWAETSSHNISLYKIIYCVDLLPKNAFFYLSNESNSFSIIIQWQFLGREEEAGDFSSDPAWQEDEGRI